ncbi:nuclear transport factor 2 family protein [Candidatus Mycolicibacterium alkanivorans]|uniref:Nuclear transport factor 2 family protein n=1 Tax=Candidatus Mycolicibacterium alkanivorans TaxID=2954114 RepID=A0ABS9YXE4_9MYCO|nr:nuclear transport factor 2 family protein [Candidatus Mycolicibacterium alkanivorans]MCI4675884.1 nuclear transport factor 2 family protein [Candidatus Mycolicibacterium alkanivorans]
MLKLTGRYGDGWLPLSIMISDPEEYEAKLAKIRAAARNSGRDPVAETLAHSRVPGYSRGMYHRFVRRQIRRGYGLISTGQFDELVAQFAPDALFSFPGDHALGGEFRGPDAVRAWFAEVRRLFPDFRLEPRRIVVEGGPLHTRAATWFAVFGTFPDGTHYRNEGAQLLELRRGRVQEDRLFEDTKVVIDALDRLRALGMDPGATLARRRSPHGSEQQPGSTSD